jgi:hypothetical protein
MAAASEDKKKSPAEKDYTVITLATQGRKLVPALSRRQFSPGIAVVMKKYSSDVFGE